jgi:H/ACA ribonucleoprotein complex subunit 4
VSRQTRVRSVYEIDVIEQKERLILMRILCESGTYIRKIFYDIGEVLGPGATMIELRRTRVSQFNEDSNLVKMHDLVDAYAMWKEKKDDSKLRRILMPIEYVLSELKSVVIRDSAVDALCHGAQLAIPGILEISHGIAKGDFVGIYTQKGEVVALAEAILSESEIVENTKGFAFQLRRIIMAPNTYPKNWRTKPVINN